MLCAGGARRGRLRLKPPLQGEVSPQATEGCGILPCEYTSGQTQAPPAGVNARPTMRGRRVAEPEATGCRPLVRADDFIGP